MATIIAPLGNFTAPSRIDLDRHLSIELIPDHLKAEINVAKQYGFIRHPENFTHCAVCTDYEGDNDKESREFMQDLLLLFGLFKPGNLYYNFGLIDRNGWYQDPAHIQNQAYRFGIFIFYGWSHPGIVDIYELANDDLAPLASFVTKNRKNSLLRRSACKYFFRAYHEPYTDDRFLYYAISLENMLVNDTKDISSIKYKFVDRGCFLLKKAIPSSEGANEISKSLSDIYDLRSKIVHSSRTPITINTQDDIEILQNADKYTRVLLRFIMENQEYYESTYIDKIKRDKY
jgi:hypothetical protein